MFGEGSPLDNSNGLFLFTSGGIEMVEQMHLFTLDEYIELWAGVPYLVHVWLTWDLQIVGCEITELEYA